DRFKPWICWTENPKNHILRAPIWLAASISSSPLTAGYRDIIHSLSAPYRIGFAAILEILQSKQNEK
ncbi:MAG: hypothetical protein ACO3L5_13520, partial [Paracoccaceae bacterium]